eukprot:gene1315-2_t
MRLRERCRRCWVLPLTIFVIGTLFFTWHKQLLGKARKSTVVDLNFTSIYTSNPYKRNMLGLQPWYPHQLDHLRESGSLDELPWPHTSEDALSLASYLLHMALFRDSDVKPVSMPRAPESDEHSIGVNIKFAVPNLHNTVTDMLQSHNNFLSCNPQEQDYKSAVARAKTAQCKRAIKRAACLNEKGLLYPSDVHTTADAATCPTPVSIESLRYANQQEREGQKYPDRGNVRGASDGGLTVITPIPRPIRLAIMIVAHGRALRTLKMLLASLYRPHHMYLIHVDERSTYLHDRLVEEVTGIPNVIVANFRLDAIWGATHLYQVYLNGIKALLPFPWDYFINLSGADLPLRPIDDLAAFLTPYASKGYNFLKSHGNDHNRFISRQGFDKTWVQCDHHMYRIGGRKLPPSLRIAGGSDWFMLHRSFAEYVVSDDPLLNELRRYYDHSLLAAESFFHMAAHNSIFCPKMITANWRFANWNRKLGCRCQYSHIVDWCGCSPIILLQKDLRWLKMLPSHPNFLARKFDGRISHTIIYDVLKNLVLRVPLPVTRNFYWENVFSFGFPGTSQSEETYFYAFVRQSVQVFTVFHGNKFYGYVVIFSAIPSGAQNAILTLESIIRTSSRTLVRKMHDIAQPLENQLVGSGYDAKERIFYKFGGLLSEIDSPKAAQYWASDPPSNVETEWFSPSSEVSVGKSRAVFDEDKRVSVSEMPQTVLHLAEGLWRVDVIDVQAQKTLASTQVPVIPLHTAYTSHSTVDETVSRFWNVDDVCLQQGSPEVLCKDMNSEDSVISFCRHVDWSPNSLQSDFDLKSYLFES